MSGRCGGISGPGISVCRRCRWLCSNPAKLALIQKNILNFWIRGIRVIVGTDSKTVEKYVDLLEKCFIIFKLNGFSRNLRTELKKAKKFYFYDNGIRNAILQNFAPLSLRQDTGALWENFFISERIKANQYAGRYVNSYFWRTSQQQEIDYIEESDGRFSVFELKWNPKRANTKIPMSFIDTYDVKEQAVVTPDNWLEWL